MFNAFERAVAGRYLRARRGERFVSVIAGFSLVGIALGVATLIIVMSVMGGFKVDLLNRILGFNGAPEAGDRVAVVENEARAREVTEYRQRQKRERAAARAGTARGSLADMMSQLKTAGRKEFPLLIKGDVQGSVEAIVGALDKLGNDEVGARIIHSGAGGINESDITLAETSGAAVIGFNVCGSAS